MAQVTTTRNMRFRCFTHHGLFAEGFEIVVFDADKKFLFSTYKI